MKILIVRNSRKASVNETIGLVFVLDEDNNVLFRCLSLERPWKDNRRGVSCIPLGSYSVFKHVSMKLGSVLKFEKVNDRSDILIHVANKVNELRGCISLGLIACYITSTKSSFMYCSKTALRRVMIHASRIFIVHIVESDCDFELEYFDYTEYLNKLYTQYTKENLTQIINSINANK
jgi:hypothetical protein